MSVSFIYYYYNYFIFYLNVLLHCQHVLADIMELTVARSAAFLCME